MASNPPNSIANDLLDKFNNASSTTVALGTLGAVLGSYAFIKLFQNRRVIAGSVIKQARKVPLAKSLVNKQLTKDLEKLDHSLRIKGDTHVLKTLPETGFSHDQVLSIMQEYCDLESKWKDGKLSGCVYHGGKEHTEMMNKAYSLFSLTNPLHPDVFPSVKKFESEIVAMAVNMLGNVEGVCGAVTSGGTESILMAIKAHRDYFNIPNPEMIIPISAHPAFNKAASYFGIKLVIIPVGDDYRANVSEMRKAINKNTILLVASAPSFPHGMIDPVEEIAALADEFGIGCHVDCCLGGFFLPWITDGSIPNFDFRVKGVTSMSADTHKYGYSVKGTSVVLFRNEQIRRSMYFVTTEWPGGIYASPTISGSRPGGLIAATWASLVSIGQKGFYENVRLIMETQKIIKDGINKLEDVQLIGDSKTMVIAFTSQTLNIFAIYGEMHQRGWVLNALQNPSSVHICLTFAHNGMAEKFLNDLKESIEASRSKPKGGDEAHLYGLAYGFPDRSLVHEMVSGYLDVCLKAQVFLFR